MTTQTLVDTGATSSAISLRLLECFPNGKRCIFRKTPKICVSVNNQPLKSLFTVKLPILLQNNRTVHHEFEVIDGLIHPALLGTDFLKSQEAKLDFSTNSLQLGKVNIPFQIPEWSPPKPSHLTSFDNVVLEPSSISLVRADFAGLDPRLTNPDLDNLLIGPLLSDFFGNDFLASYSVIDPKAPEIWVEVLNPSDSPIHIPQGEPIAWIEGENPEIETTEISRDLSCMPSNLDEKGEVEDFCGGVGHLFGDGTGVEKNNFDPPNCNFTPAFSDQIEPECDTTPTHFTAAFTDEPNLDSEGPLGAQSTTHAGPPRSDGRDAPVMVEVVEEAEYEREYPFTPRAVMTKQGLIELKPDYDTLFGLEPLQEQTVPDSYVEIPPEFATKQDTRKYEPNFDGCVFEGEDLEKLKQIVGDFPEIFASHAEDIGKTTLLYHYTNLTTDKPVSASYYRSPPPKVREDIDRETQKLLSAGIIRESESPYSAPIVLVRKPDGTWRYCTDFRKLNAITQKVSFPIPSINDSLRRFQNPKYFSSLDLLKGFFQIEVSESHKHFYGFSDGRRHLEYNRVPMGSKNSSSTLAQLMEIVFRGFPPEYFLSYLDDILLATPTVELHLTYLERIFSALKRAGLKLNPLKCKFGQRSVSTLGFVMDSNGIRPDPANLAKIRDWPAPVNQKQVRQFVGLCSYYRSHIVGFAKEAEPLTDLLMKSREWFWSDKQQEAYETLKDRLLHGTACSYPDFSKEFILKCDGSGSTVGAVLSQLDSRGKECIVSCASQKLNSVEAKWSALDKEFFAIIWAVRYFKHYLRFDKFKIVTDHRPLLSCLNINTNNDATGKRTRWSLELQTYSFDLLYKKGAHNTDADALSRHPKPDEPQDSDSDDIFIAGAMTTTEISLTEFNDDNDDNDFLQRLKKEQMKDVEIGNIMAFLKGPQAPVEADGRRA